MIKYVGPKLTRNYSSAGFDIKSNVDIIVPKGKCAKISTGIRMIIPDNMFARIESRSGLAFKYVVTAFNGIIDPDYRGEIIVLLRNDGIEDFNVKKGNRIAQMIFYNKYTNIKRISLEDFNSDRELNTDRSIKGFGSSKI